MEYDLDNAGFSSLEVSQVAATPQSNISMSDLSILVLNGKAETAEDVNISDNFIMAASDIQQQGDIFISDEVMLIARKMKMPAVPRQRAWTYDFDGHTFYVLDLGEFGDWVYDTSSQTWSKFETEGFNGRWDFINGFQWTAANLTIGGSLYDPMVYAIDHTSHLDGEFRKITYKSTGVLASTKREGQRVDTARLLVSIEAPLVEDAEVTLEYSDNNGISWSKPKTIPLQANQQTLDWRSLGMVRNSGRIFNITSKGALLRLDGFIVRLEGSEE